MFGFALVALGFVALFSSLVAGLVHYRVRRRPMPPARPGSALVMRRGYLLLTESLAYAGAALMLAGGVAAVGERWREVTAWEYAEIFTGAAVLFFATGFVARQLADPPLTRLTEASWFASVASAGAAAGITAHALLAMTGAGTTLAVGVVAAAYSAGLWLTLRSEAQMVTMFAGLVIAACGFGLLVGGAGAQWVSVSLGLWALGLGWAVLGWRYPEPLWTSLLVGAALALVAPGLVVWDHGWVFVVAIATSGAAVLAALAARVRPWSVVLLGLGSAGLLGYVTAAAIRYLHGPLGLPVTLAFTGVLFVGLAIASARFRHAGLPRDPGQPDSGQPGSGSPPREAPPSRRDLPRAS